MNKTVYNVKKEILDAIRKNPRNFFSVLDREQISRVGKRIYPVIQSSLQARECGRITQYVFPVQPDDPFYGDLYVTLIYRRGRYQWSPKPCCEQTLYLTQKIVLNAYGINSPEYDAAWSEYWARVKAIKASRAKK